MKVVIIGAGLIGIATAYCLASRGHKVIVIERQGGPGRETSFANGGLLTPSMAEPWNSPGSWRVLLKSLGRSDSALQLRVSALHDLGLWGVLFLKNSKPAIYERNTLKNLQLSIYSLQMLRRLREAERLAFGHSARGSLRVFRDRAALVRAAEVAHRRALEGLSFRQLSVQEATTLEPALKPVSAQLVGALYNDSDEVGDAFRFCTQLAELARQRGVEFVFDTEVTAVETRGGQILSAITTNARVAGDCYVMAAGSFTTPFLRRFGIDLPVRPAKGYSVTFDRTSHGIDMLIPVVDDCLHAVVVPLDGAIRVAGTAEFAGYDVSPNARRIANLIRLTKEILPQVQTDVSDSRPWSGLRGMSPDGVPIIGPTSIQNLWVSTGHGHLGWTMAMGSAHLLTDLLCNSTPALDPTAYVLSRFAGAWPGATGMTARRESQSC